MQTMITKLRLIADAIEQGNDVEAMTHIDKYWKNSIECPNKTGGIAIYPDVEYRIKPDKPRTGTVLNYTESAMSSDTYEGVELTEEVRAAIESAGIEI